ncbi:MAG TPA: glycosyltransferase [Legionella sp.]|nr:glycosyltransferase [Legionella sp.]
MTVNNPHITVVIPVYGCLAALVELVRRLQVVLGSITPDYEIIMVNDASPDDSWKAIGFLANQDYRVKGIRFSRNFGQHHAITAGLDHANGDWVVVMDCDLQDQPEEIVRLYEKGQEGYDVVFARRANRIDSHLKRFSSKVFYKIFDYLTEQESDPAVANFGIYRNTVIESIRQMRESVRSFPLFVRWLGFPSASIDVEHAARHAGKSSYNFSKLLHLAVNSIMAQSNRPLRISIKFGFVMAFSSILSGAWHILRYYTEGVSVEGWTSVFVSIWFIGGLMFMNLGFLGLYIGRTYDETKRRPIYVIRDYYNLPLSKDISS